MEDNLCFAKPCCLSLPCYPFSPTPLGRIYASNMEAAVESPSPKGRRPPRGATSRYRFLRTLSRTNSGRRGGGGHPDGPHPHALDSPLGSHERVLRVPNGSASFPFVRPRFRGRLPPAFRLSARSRVGLIPGEIQHFRGVRAGQKRHNVLAKKGRTIRPDVTPEIPGARHPGPPADLPELRIK